LTNSQAHRPRIAFLRGDPGKARNDNHERLPAAFMAAGWRVETLDHDCVQISANQLRIGRHDAEDFDLIWQLGFGKQVSFFDRMQLLKPVPQRRMVVSVDGLIYLHGKHRWLQHMPETHTSSDGEYLLNTLSRGGRWIIKPTAGSYGRDVRVVNADAEGKAALRTLVERYPDSYLMLQRFIPEISGGEKRTLVAGGEIIASYKRTPSGDFRANVSLAADVAIAELSHDEHQLVSSIAGELAAVGVGFAAIDTVFPYLIEVNVANPGGLGTLAELGNADATDATIRAISRWKGITPG
jgi:glutathione synthase